MARIDYTTTDIAEAVRDLDAVLETIGGDYPAKAVKILKPGGILVSTLPPTLAPVVEEAAARGIRLAGLFVEADRLGMTELASLAASGQLTPAVSATFDLEQATTAHATRTAYGKTVLTVS